MHRTIILLLSTCILLTACNSLMRGPEVKEVAPDVMNDPNVLERDKELHFGDLGIEELEENYIPQNPPNKRELVSKKFSALHHNWKYPQLHQVWVNQSVRPVNGSYTNNMINAANKYLGTPYQYGSDRNDPSSFDCSDFVRWVHLWSLGMDLPKDSRSQHEYLKKFSKRTYTDFRQAKKGDVLFFMQYKGWQPQDYVGIDKQAQTIGHNGIYLGDGKVIHTASSKTGGVRIDNLQGTHLEYRFVRGGQMIQ